MPHATILLIEQYYTAFNRQDMPNFYSLVTDDVHHDINQGQRETGKEAFKSFMERMNGCYKEQITNLNIMSDSHGRHAAAEFVVEGTYIATDSNLPPAHGQRYVLPGGAFFEIKDNKIARVTNYYNLNDWLKQIGQ